MSSPTMDSNWSFGSSGMTSPRHVRSRTQSISSDRQSTIGFGLVLPPLSVSPESCFIAVSAASQIITNDHDSHADAWYDQNGIEPAMETATISGPALRLVNDFLDQLLLNFLQLSKSTNLSALRPAIIEVLKPKLAKDAISNAEEELKEYLGGGNEDDFVKPQGSGVSQNWDLELAWKRTRLRCMVYSSLGDLEEEDEDIYMEEENLDLGTNEHISDIVSPAVAIFLTSVLEYMGELTLTVAGQAAYQRVRTKIERELREGSRNPSDPADGIVVSDSDMERVALDRTLGRLWRGWKKRMRTPANDVIGRPFSKALSVPSKQEYGPPGQSMTGLPRSATSSDGSNEPRKSQEHLEQPIVEDVQAADIPLPMTDDDVNEIEVPGLAHYSDDETDAEADEEERTPKRPRSLLPRSSITLIATRTRSLSVPTRAVPSFHPPRTRKHSRISAPGSEATSDDAAELAETGVAQGDEEASETRVVRAKSVVAAEDSQSDESEYDDAAEQVAYEKAEIMTSSRVSVSGSCYSAETDANSKHKHGPPRQRSSSVHSARIIDVAAPKSPSPRSPRSPRSPAHSRPGSLDGKSDGLRSATLSGVAAAVAVAAAAAAATPEDRRETPGQKPAGQATSKGPTHNTSISETDETRTQTQQPSTREPGRNEALPDAPAMLAAGSMNVPTKGRKRGPPGKINTKLQTYAHEHEHEQAPPSARAVPLPVTPANYAAEEEGVPGFPQRASGHGGRQSPRTESRGIVTIERTRTHESDEVSLPLQSGPNSRQVHTAASSVSSATSRLKLVRTSEDDSSRSESVARNFEELIQSNQTITYTLTPENMRDVDAKSPVVTKFARRKSEDVRALNSPKFPPSNSGRQPSPRLPSAPSSPKIVEGKTPIATKPSGSGPRAPIGLVISTSRESVALAREARVPTDTTTSDFAEFIKFTGPADESKAHTVPRLATPVSPGKSVRDSRRASTTSSLNRARHQPRDAAVDSRADNSDLIDFIRQGPPIAPSNHHRIPRHVAPFRTTMDSDQMAGAIGGKAVDASLPDIRNSQGSTNVTDSSMPSVHSSVNSKSALLRNKGASTMPASKMFAGEDDAMPKRKTRRARDPYAIDLSDEEDDDEEEEDDDHAVETPRIPAKKEESLAEFLRNYDPPPEPVSSPPRLPKKKASAPSLMGRFTRGVGKDKDKDKDSASIRGGQETRSVHSRASGRGYIPIQVNLPAGYDMFGPVDKTRSSVSRTRGTSIASSTTAARRPMKRFEPREAVTNHSHTADLAAFLRDSAPPPNNSPTVIDRAPSRQEESGGSGGGGIAKMFGRRKKPLAV